MIAVRAEVRLMAARRGTMVIKSANENGNGLRKYSAGSRQSERCEKPGIVGYSKSGGSSLSRRPLTTWCGCGICCPRQFKKHKSGEKCARAPENRAFGHKSREPAASSIPKYATHPKGQPHSNGFFITLLIGRYGSIVICSSNGVKIPHLI